MFKLAMTVACAVVAMAVVPSLAAAQAPAFGGEVFTESDPTITSCAAGEGGGPISYEASGTATGAYPGTFTETGMVTVGPEEGPALRQRVTAASISFTVDSPAGQVTGTKTFVPAGDPNINVATGRCDFDGVGGSITIFADDLRYSVTIQTPDGQTCTQSGGASLQVIDDSSVVADTFTERFLNDISAPAPVCTGGEEPPPEEPEMPVSKDDCRDGGYARYGFKNQGECIAWVNRNLP
jgi:hypothetical protein